VSEAELVAAILRGDPAVSRNRNFALFASEVGRRARRRAAYLRSIAQDLERTRRGRGGVVTIERGSFARGRGCRLVIHQRDGVRRAYLTDDEVALLERTFPLAEKLFDVREG
jgi:hypothetical protein